MATVPSRAASPVSSGSAAIASMCVPGRSGDQDSCTPGWPALSGRVTKAAPARAPGRPNEASASSIGSRRPGSILAFRSVANMTIGVCGCSWRTVPVSPPTRLACRK